MKRDVIYLGIIVVLIILLIIIFFYGTKIRNSFENIKINNSLGNINYVQCIKNEDCHKSRNNFWECVPDKKCVCLVPEIEDYVCGVDNSSYINIHELNCKGITLLHKGKCSVKEEDSLCGNQRCDISEGVKEFCGSQAGCTKNPNYCPTDCLSEIKCGNGICESNELEEEVNKRPTCPEDYPACDWVKRYIVCPQDCKSEIKCGDGKCQKNDYEAEVSSYPECPEKFPECSWTGIKFIVCPKDCDNLLIPQS